MKVAIIGTAPASRGVAPFDDKEWDIWACSQGNQGQLPRVTAWFELHSLTALMGKENQAWSIPYLGWLRSQTFPVYMQEPNDGVPQAIVFPWKELVAQFGRNWFSSSVAWMMAFAIRRGATEIGLFGVDMAADLEHYTGQRAGCWRFIEICKERGIRVTIPHESCLGQSPPLYGYSESTLMGRRLYLRRDEMKSQRAQLAAQRDRLSNEILFYDGAIETTDYMIRTFLDGADADLAVEPPKEDDDHKPGDEMPKLDDFRQKGALLVPKVKTGG